MDWLVGAYGGFCDVIRRSQSRDVTNVAVELGSVVTSVTLKLLAGRSH